MHLKVKGKIWRYPGFGGWHFFTLSMNVSKKIKNLMHGRLRGFGSIRVKAKIGKSEFRTSIFPTKEGHYLLPIKADVRMEEEVGAGDTVSVRLTLFI